MKKNSHYELALEYLSSKGMEIGGMENSMENLDTSQKILWRMHLAGHSFRFKKEDVFAGDIVMHA